MLADPIALCTKIRYAVHTGQARHVRIAPAEILLQYSERDCHHNVARWVAEHPEHKAVLGWLITAEAVYALHSVVDTGKDLLDITPRPGIDAAAMTLFVRENLPRAILPSQLVDIEA